jgi:hypothetical protein
MINASDDRVDPGYPYNGDHLVEEEKGKESERQFAGSSEELGVL